MQFGRADGSALTPNLHSAAHRSSLERDATLLAPAGSLEAAERAFAAGADAVYVGLKGWSRGGARGELDRKQLRDCIGMADRLGKKVQLALNIIPKPQQREQLLKEVSELAGWGIKAVIVSDVGVLREIRQKLPMLPVTVSVGCGALHEEDARFYQDLGASTVVLPGYLEPPEVAAIKAKSTIKIEVMLHMVEEFTQLGKCWLPSFFHLAASERMKPLLRLAGSVKRGGVGTCFRICQRPWKLLSDAAEVDDRFLPARQISRLAAVGEFLDAGADVIKIQGRSLSADMVGIVTRSYRSAMDNWKTRSTAEYDIPVLPPMWTVQGR